MRLWAHRLRRVVRSPRLLGRRPCVQRETLSQLQGQGDALRCPVRGSDRAPGAGGSSRTSAGSRSQMGTVMSPPLAARWCQWGVANGYGLPAQVTRTRTLRASSGSSGSPAPAVGIQGSFPRPCPAEALRHRQRWEWHVRQPRAGGCGFPRAAQNFPCHLCQRSFSLPW